MSRTIGDAEIKEEKFGGKKGIIIPTPDIVFIDNCKAKYIVMGCDGIYDVLSNEEIATSERALQDARALLRYSE